MHSKKNIRPNFWQAFLMTFVLSNFSMIVFAGILVVIGHFILHKDMYDLVVPYEKLFSAVLSIIILFVVVKYSRVRFRLNIRKIHIDIHILISVVLLSLFTLYVNQTYCAFLDFNFACNSFLYGFEKSICDSLHIYIIAPIVEEILFRGIIQRRFMKQYSVFNSILFSSILFALFHGQIFRYPEYFIGYLFAGIILGLVYYKTKSIFYPLIMHLIHNLLPAVFYVVFIGTQNRMLYIDFLSSYWNMFILLIFSIIAYVLIKNISGIKSLR